MESKKLKITNKNQFEKLVHIMNENPEIAKGFSNEHKKQSKGVWERVTRELNCLGPPIRNEKEWKKVWIDYKAKVKQAIAFNKKEQKATGGGEYQQISLTPLQQNVDALLSITKSIHPTGRSFGIEENEENCDEENVSLTNNNTFMSAENTCAVTAETSTTKAPFPNRTTSTPIARRAKGSADDERLKLLTDQTNFQKETVNIFKNIEKNTYSIKRQLEKLCEYNKETIELKREEMKAKMLWQAEYAEIKKQKLEIELRKIEIEERKLLITENRRKV